MSDKKAIAIIGYSGHSYVVSEILIEQGCKLEFYTDKLELILNPFGLKYLGCETDHDFQGWERELSYALGIGNNMLREKTAQIVVNNSGILKKVISNHSVISKTAQVGDGVFISKGVLVNALVQIEDYAILNTGCIIEHECVISCAAHIGPGAVLAGNVSIGRRTFVGSNAVIKQGINIGDDVLIGAGSVIINDVPNNTKMVGNPGRIIL